MNLKDKKCIPCSGEIPPLKLSEKEKLLNEISKNWELSDDKLRLSLKVDTKDFATSLLIANKIGEEADKQWHHPRLVIEFKQLTIEIWTHKINNLVESDFIFAAKVDEILLQCEGG